MELPLPTATEPEPAITRASIPAVLLASTSMPETITGSPTPSRVPTAMSLFSIPALVEE